MTQREQETRRRRRERREALENAEREFVVGRPLVDIGAPVAGGGSGPEHMLLVQQEMERRAHAASYEVGCLMVYFARKCWVRYAVAERMPRDLMALLLAAGPMKIPATHSTLPGSTPTDIPAL